jgi:hypothetical protein
MPERHFLETAGNVSIDITECIVQKNGKRYKHITKTFKGPKNQVERLQWKPFGAAKNNTSETTVVSEVEVEFEFFKQMKSEIWIPNGLYMSYARKDNWTPGELKCLMVSKRPDHTYREIYSRKLNTSISEAIEKANKVSNIPVQPVQVQPVEPQTTKLNTAGLSLKDMLKLKSQQRSDVTISGGGITDRLKQKQEQKSDKKCTIYVQNVPEDFTETDLASHLTEFDISRISITRRPNHQGVMESAGSAFIDCYEEAETERCIVFLNTCKFEHQVLCAQHARPKVKKF